VSIALDQISQLFTLLITEPASGVARLTHRGLVANVGGVLPPVQEGEPASWLASSQLWLPAPTVGEVVVPPSAGEVLRGAGVGSVVPWMWTELVPVNLSGPPPPRETAVSRNGTFTVTEYSPPTATARGLVRMRYEVGLELWDGSALTGKTLTLAGDLVLPVYPGEWPNGAP